MWESTLYDGKSLHRNIISLLYNCCHICKFQIENFQFVLQAFEIVSLAFLMMFHMNKSKGALKNMIQHLACSMYQIHQYFLDSQHYPLFSIGRLFPLHLCDIWYRLIFQNSQECLKIPMFGYKLQQGIRCQGNLDSPFNPHSIGMWIPFKTDGYPNSQV